MKKIITVLLGVLLIGMLSYAKSVKQDIVEEQAKINRKQQEINADLEEAKIKYREKPTKLAEKKRKYDFKQEKLNYDKKELQFKKDNVGLLTKIENKRNQIHLEKRKVTPNWKKIERLTNERNKLENKYDEKKLKVLY